MALNQVHNYSIWHQAGSDKAEIRLLLDTGSLATISNLPLASANFIVDLPVSYTHLTLPTSDLG